MALASGGHPLYHSAQILINSHRRYSSSALPSIALGSPAEELLPSIVLSHATDANTSAAASATTSATTSTTTSTTTSATTSTTTATTANITPVASPLLLFSTPIYPPTYGHSVATIIISWH
ncbi:hypothetical protein BASA83_000542 [Batrachochytrium salamandrivorans]|nr:hypothetical protein BASA83_000542 [Batrachochytrium salamandrivorans]